MRHNLGDRYSDGTKQPRSMKELAGLTRPIGMLIEFELSIFITTNDMFTYLVDDHVSSPNHQARYATKKSLEGQ